MTKKRILIVDDEPDIVQTIQFHLETGGFECLVASDGEEALSFVKRNEPDLIILDVMLPKTNGYQICRELKRNPETRNIPVVMLSAKSQQSDQFWGKEVGATDYITKPFEMEELMEKIRGFLEQ